MKKLFLGMTLLSAFSVFANAELKQKEIRETLLLDAACKQECSLGSFSGEDGSHFVKRDVQYVDFKAMTLEEIEKRQSFVCESLAKQAREEGRFNLSRDVEKMKCKYFKH